MKISEQDAVFYRLAREHISAFRKSFGQQAFDAKLVLEIGPENGCERSGMMNWDTLNIVPGCDIQADITKLIPQIANTYDLVVCLEVLEHTTNPFAALAEIRRVLKPGGLLLASAPWNFRIHGPKPDAWRFSEHGWKILLKDWDDLQIDALETPDRFLMPIHYNVSARCNKTKDVDPATLEFRWIS